jgi:hypothetical protein
MSNNMFNNNWDPYDALIVLQARLDNVEAAHNRLAHDYLKTQADLSLALNSLHSLQKGHLALSELVSQNILFKMGQK